MYTFMFLQLITFSISNKIAKIDEYDLVNIIGKKGYKIKKDRFNEIEKNNLEIRNNTILNILFSIIPIINMVYAYIDKKKKLEQAFNYINDFGALEKMDIYEKNIYNELKDKSSKLFWLVTSSNLNNINNNEFNLYQDKLVSLSYTLNEVKKLNDITNGYYKVGKMDGLNIAIIGIKGKIRNFNKIVTYKNNKCSYHDFEEMSLDEAKDKHFIVYPAYKYELDKCIDEIRDERHSKRFIYSNITNYSIDTNIKIKTLYKKYR